MTGVPGGTSVPAGGFCLLTLLPPFFLTLPLVQPAASSFFFAFLTGLPLTGGTMQLETTVALKPSSRLRRVLAVLGTLLSVRGGT